MICEKFAQEGCNVVVNYNASPERAKEVAEKCRSYGVKAATVQGVMHDLPSALDFQLRDKNRTLAWLNTMFDLYKTRSTFLADLT